MSISTHKFSNNATFLPSQKLSEHNWVQPFQCWQLAPWQPAAKTLQNAGRLTSVKMQVLSLRFKPVTTRNSNIILTYLSNISSAHSFVAIWEKQKQEIFHKTLILPPKINTALKRIQIRYFFRYKHDTRWKPNYITILSVL